MYRIKDFAALCGCSIYTLRYYDEIDLLKPHTVNNDSGYRYYVEEQILQFLEIKEFQEIGFRVNEIREIKLLSDEEIADLILKRVNYLQEKLEKSVVLMRKYLERD